MKNELLPYISVIVPAYNVEEYIRECIESIIDQSYKNYELILVDDGSTDTTGDICDEYANGNDSIQVIHKKNGGLVSARKAGLKVASGTYICYVDGDDWIDAETLSMLASCANEYNVDMVISDFVYVFKDGTKNLGHNIEGGLYTKEKMKEELLPQVLCTDTYFQFGIQPSLCSKLYRKELLMNNQFDVPEMIKLGEDAACTYPCLCQAESVYYLKGYYCYFYRMRVTSISHTVKRTFYEKEILALINFLKHKFLVYNCYDILKVQLSMYFGYMVDNLFTSFISIKHLFFDNKLKKSVEEISNSEIGKEMLDVCLSLYTSSRARRIFVLLNHYTCLNKIDLYLFRIYEKLG